MRRAKIKRLTAETDINLTLDLDGAGKADISTGLGFFDHMLHALAKHSKIDLTLDVKGDLEVDDHHTIEDTGICLGMALFEALGDKRGLRRFAHAYAPLDEALARAVVDLSGRPWPRIELDLLRPSIGPVACENLTHFFQSLALSAKMSLHLDVLHGENDHHKAEAAFKAFALALKEAVSLTGSTEIPSTKGAL